jgi:ABC-type glycerol-3-phosphate transport system substrate-binding protein
MNYRRTLIFSLLAVLLLAACGGGAQSGPGPADVARQFFEVAFSGEGDIAPLVCSAAADDVEAMREGLTQVAASGAEVDVSGLTFTEQNVSGDTAEVVVGGRIAITVAGTEQEMDFPEQTIPMRNENGWKVCA